MRHAPGLRTLGGMLVAFCPVAPAGRAAAQPVYEAPATLRAADRVPASRLAGPRYTIDEVVPGARSGRLPVLDRGGGSVRAGLAAKDRELRLTGQVSSRARQELSRLGWTVQEQAVDPGAAVTR